MNVWAIADLHLAFGTPDKSMEVFGPQWENYPQRIEQHWKERIASEDLVLIAGDISWAMKLEQAQKDLLWIDSLPGTKVMIRGNHDYWWSSAAKVRQHLPPSIHIIQNDAFHWKELTIGGARMWDSDEYDFNEYILFRENKHSKPEKVTPDREKIFQRELGRLELSLKALSPSAKTRLVMTHYPPIDAKLACHSQVAKLLEQYRVNQVIFGHLHSLKPNLTLFGTKNDISYHLTSSDYLDFVPLQLILS